MQVGKFVARERNSKIGRKRPLSMSKCLPTYGFEEEGIMYFEKTDSNDFVTRDLVTKNKIGKRSTVWPERKESIQSNNVNSHYARKVENNLEIPKYIISPTSQFRSCWDLYMCILLVRLLLKI